MNIKTLLNKKTWTGAEIGKALIAVFADDVRNRGKDHEPLLSQADFDRMLNSLDTEPQIGAYLVYQKIYSSCLDNYNKSQALKQQFFHGYYRLLLELEQVLKADNALKAVQEYPLILSKSQYDRIVEQRKRDLRAFEDTFYDVLFGYLTYCIENIEKAPAAVRKAIEACKEEPATNKRILSHYCEDLGLGYYRLPDGTESRSSSTEEWVLALNKTWAEHHGLTNEANERGLDEVRREYNQNRRLEVLGAVFNGEDAIKKLFKNKLGKDFDEKELGFSAADLAEKLLDRTASSKEIGFTEGDLEPENYCIWHEEELPEDISKYDIISEQDLILRYADGIAGEELSAEEQLAEFKKDYPKLFSALQVELKKQLKIKKATPSKKYTWGELADLGIENYISRIEVNDFDIIEYYCKENTEENYNKRQRALYSGIAIATDKNSRIDETTGDYIEPPNPYSKIGNLDNITVEDAERIEGYLITLIEPAARHLLAYNMLLDILAELYNVPDLKAAKEDLLYFYDKAETFNNLLYHTFSTISGSLEEKKRKRQLIKEYFRPIKLEDLEPVDQIIEEVKEKLRNLVLNRKAE